MQINIQARFTNSENEVPHDYKMCLHEINNIWFKTNKFIECVSETILPRLQHDVMKAERPLFS